MNELKIIDIYNELKNKYTKYHDAMSVAERAEFTTLLNDLKAKAAEVGIDVEAPNNMGQIDDVEDVLELVAFSKTNDAIRGALVTAIKKATKEPTNRQVFDLIRVIDKYYAANVVDVDAAEVENRLKDIITIEHFVDKNELANAYKKAAQDTIVDAMKKAEANEWKSDIAALDAVFQEFFTKERKLLETTVVTKDLGSQFSLNLAQWTIYDSKWLGLTGSASLEFLASQNDVVLIKNHDSKEAFEDSTISLFKQSVNTKLSSAVKGDFASKYATTIFTYADTSDLAIPFVQAIEAFLGVNFKYTTAVKMGSIAGGNPFKAENQSDIPKFAIGVTLFTIQLKLQIDKTESFKSMIGDPNFPIKKLL